MPPINNVLQSGLGRIILKGAWNVFLVQSGGAFLLLLSEVVLARLLGVEQFGLYATITVWISLLFLIGTLGFNYALLRYVPVYVVNESWGELRGLLSQSTRWAGMAAVTAALVMFGVVWLRNDPGSPVIPAFAVALVGLPLQTLTALRQAVLRGLQHNVRSLFPDYIIRPLVLIILLGLGAGFLAPISVVTALIFNLMAIIAAYAVGSWWQHSHLPAGIRVDPPIRRDREWFGVALPLLGIVGLSLLESGRMDLILLSILRNGDAEAGIYAAANRIAEIILFIVAIANIMVVPMIARLHAAGEQAELQKTTVIAVKLMLSFALPAALLLSIFGRELLTLFGTDFAAGYYPFMILLVAQLVAVLFGPVLFLLTMTGHHQEAFKVMGLTVSLKMVGAMVLVPGLGMTGAAGATLASVLLSNVVMRRIVLKKLGIEPSFMALFRRYRFGS